MEENEIKNRFEAALNEFLTEDLDLLTRNVNERSLTHRLALYLEKQFQGWHIDCEYNRNGYQPKEINILPQNASTSDTEGRSVFPDIIVHQRGHNDKNLLVVEVKKSTGTKASFEYDRNKIRAFRDSEVYRYQVGCFLVFSVGADAGADLEWI
ncbi:MAG: hypothetical protein KIS88_09195 [Anaerolineales bacterium]|nr:hypothetical protein [Anaerolineales bacterium]